MASLVPLDHQWIVIVINESRLSVVANGAIGRRWNHWLLSAILIVISPLNGNNGDHHWWWCTPLALMERHQRHFCRHLCQCRQWRGVQFHLTLLPSFEYYFYLEHNWNKECVYKILCFVNWVLFPYRLQFCSLWKYQFWFSVHLKLLLYTSSCELILFLVVRVNFDNIFTLPL